MHRMRLVALASGLVTLALGPAIAGAQTTNASGSDRYGGAKVGEDVNKPATTTTPAPDQSQQAQPTAGHEDQGQPQEPSVNQNVTVTPNTAEAQEAPAPAQNQPQPNVNVFMPQQQPQAQPAEEEREEPQHYLPFGLALSVGGGITEFTGREMRDSTNLGGAWDARVAFGTRSLLGLEAAYVGTATPLDTLGLDNNAILMSHGVEGLARLNIGTFNLQPFIVGGVAWQHYSITNTNSNTSDFNDNDDVLAIPFGGGISSYIGGRTSHFMVDARFIYRATFNDNLARPGTANAGGNGLSNWSTTLRLGYEF